MYNIWAFAGKRATQQRSAVQKRKTTMTNYPPLYNSPSDFAIYGNKFTAIPVPQPSSKAGSNGNIISYPPPPPQHHEYPPPCPTPSWNRSTGPLLPEGDPFYFSPAIHRRSRSSCGTTWRIILTIVTFCVGCLVLFFALAHIQGADLFPENMEPDTGAAKRYQRYARSEPIVEMKEILADFKEKGKWMDEWDYCVHSCLLCRVFF